MLRLLLAFILLAGAMSPQSILILKKKGGAPPSYLIDEGFEGTGAPSGWASSGTVDWDEATIFHDGAQAFQADSSATDSYGRTAAVTAQNEIYGKFWFYADHIPSTNAGVFRVMNNATALATIQHTSGGALRIFPTGGSAAVMTLGTGEDTWVRVWFHYVKGTGADAQFQVWWATTDTHPGNGDAQYYQSSNNGTSTAQIDRCDLFSDNAGTTNGSRFYDDLKVAATQVW